jgi:hypothetical protein
MKKRILSVFMAVVMVIGVIPGGLVTEVEAVNNIPNYVEIPGIITIGFFENPNLLEFRTPVGGVKEDEVWIFSSIMVTVEGSIKDVFPLFNQANIIGTTTNYRISGNIRNGTYTKSIRFLHDFPSDNMVTSLKITEGIGQVHITGLFDFIGFEGYDSTLLDIKISNAVCKCALCYNCTGVERTKPNYIEIPGSITIGFFENPNLLEFRTPIGGVRRGENWTFELVKISFRGSLVDIGDRLRIPNNLDYDIMLTRAPASNVKDGTYTANAKFERDIPGDTTVAYLDVAGGAGEVYITGFFFYQGYVTLDINVSNKLCNCGDCPKCGFANVSCNCDVCYNCTGTVNLYAELSLWNLSHDTFSSKTAIYSDGIYTLFAENMSNTPFEWADNFEIVIHNLFSREEMQYDELSGWTDVVKLMNSKGISVSDFKIILDGDSNNVISVNESQIRFSQQGGKTGSPYALSIRFICFDSWFFYENHASAVCVSEIIFNEKIEVAFAITGLDDILDACDCGECNKCNPLTFARIPGDVDGNGVVTITDALEILMYLAGMDSALDQPDNFNAARVITGGEKPTINDALEILMYLAGMESVFGKPAS